MLRILGCLEQSKQGVAQSGMAWVHLDWQAHRANAKEDFDTKNDCIADGSMQRLQCSTPVIMYDSLLDPVARLV